MSRTDDKPLLVICELTVSRDRWPELQPAIDAMAHASRNEPGCVEYDYYRPYTDGSDADTVDIVFVERFVSQAAASSHRHAPYVERFFEAARATGASMRFRKWCATPERPDGAS